MPSGQTVRLASLVAVALPLIGCAPRAFDVSTNPKNGGLPFYAKSVVYRQHSVYQYDWLRVTLSSAPVLATVDGVDKLGAKTTRVVDLSNDGTNRGAILQLEQLVASVPGTQAGNLRTAGDAIEGAFQKLTALPPGNVKEPTARDMRPAGNYVERVTVVDYDKTYYLNGNVPRFGSSNLSTELAADGTLAKGSNNVTGGGADAISAIASAVTGVLPIKEFLTSKWVPKPAEQTALNTQSLMIDMPAIGPVRGPIRYEMSVEPKAVLYDFTTDHKARPDGTNITTVPIDYAKGLYAIHPVDKAAEPAKDDGGISFSGKVQLPTEKKP